jgi:competence protein ComEC
LWPKATHVLPLSFRRTPLLFAAGCFALGEAFTKFPVSPRLTILLAAGTAALLAFTLLALRRAFQIVLLPVGALWLGIGLWSVQLEPAPAPQTALLAYADGLSRTVEGRIVRVSDLPPRPPRNDVDRDRDGWDEAGGTPALSVDLDVNAIEHVTPDISQMVPLRGGVRITVLASNAAQGQFHCGDRLRVPLRLRVPERYRDPGAWQYADYLLDQGIAATAYVRADKLTRLPGSPAPSLRCRVFAAQSWAAMRMLDYARSPANRRLPTLLRLTPDDAGMLDAMLFGDRTRLDHSLRVGFERTGSFHLFVVSGLHVAVLAGLLMWAARSLGLAEWLATLITLLLLPAFAILTGFGVPVQRALLMATVFLVTRLLSRERNRLNALGAAALAVLVWSPRALFEASFQMTFLAIVAIAGIAIPLGERTFLPYLAATRRLGESWRDASMLPRVAHFRVMLRFWIEAMPSTRMARALPIAVQLVLRAAELTLISLIAEAVMVLPMAMYFHRVTLFALPANIFSIPLIGVLVPLGIATFVASLASPWAAVVPASALAALLHAVSAVTSRLAHAQLADLRTPGPRIAAALLAFACFAVCCWAVRRSRAVAWTALAVLPLAALLALWPAKIVANRGTLEITAIDVGQGDSLLILSPAGHAMLIDAGGPTGAAANAENATGPSTFDVGEEVVSPYLWSRQVRRLDVVALTHAHSDHMGGMPAVLRNFRPRELWVAADPNSAAFRDLLHEAADLGIKVRHMRAGDQATWDGVQMTALAPAVGYANSGPPVNNDSLVLRMQYGRAAALLEGDAEAPSEQTMVTSAAHGGPQLGPNALLKVGHHGSRTSTTPAFLQLAAPKDAVISVGKGNTFGHPRPEIIERLAEAHARVFRTDEFGLTSFVLSPDGGIAAAPIASNH